MTRVTWLGAGRDCGRRRADRGRATATRSSSRRGRSGSHGDFVAHDAKALGVDAADDTMILAYLIEPGRASYELDDLAAEYAVELQPEPEAEEETARLVRHAAATLRLRDPLLERVRERGAERLYRDVEMPLVGVLAAMEGGRRQDRHVPDGRDHRAARRPGRGAGGACLRAGRRGVRARLAAAARADPVREARAHRRAARARPATRPTRRCCARSAPTTRSCPVIEEWRELSKLLNTYLVPLPEMLGEDGRLHTHFNQTVAATGRLSTLEPEPAVDPDPHRDRPRDPLGVRRRAGPPADLGRLLADRAADPRARLRRAEAARGVRARRGHPHGDGGRGARRRPGEADDRPAQRREDDQLRDRLRDLGVRPLGEPRDPARAGAGVHRRLPRALPASCRTSSQRTIEQAEARRLRDEPAGRRRPVPELRAREPADARPRRAGRGQLRHAGLERRRDQGGDGRDPRAACARRGGAPRLVLQVHDELLLEAPDAEVSR